MLLAILSLLLQGFAAVQAARVGRVTGPRGAWNLVSAAIVLMVVQRALTLRLTLDHPGLWLVSANSAIEATVSVLLVLGLHALAPLLGRAHRAEDAERRSAATEARHRQIVETTMDGVWTLDPAGSTTYVNRRMAEMLGYEPGEMLGRPVREFLAEEGREQALASLARSAGGAGGHPDFAFMHRDGHTVWTLVASSALRDEDGNPEGTLAMVTDITRRRASEMALRDSEARAQRQAEELRSVLDVVPAPVWITRDPGAREIVGNRAAHEFLRVPAGRNMSMSAPAAEAPRNFRVLKEGAGLRPEELPMQRSARLGVEIRDFEETVLFEDGDERQLYGNVAPLRGPDGAPHGAVGAFIDITARRQVESALRESEERFRQFAEQSPDGFWFTELHPVPRMRYVSPGFASLWGRPVEAVLADPGEWLAAIHPEDRRAVERAWGELLKSGGLVPYDLEFRIVRPDGTQRWVRDRATLIRDAGGQPVRVSGIASDVTQRKRSEAIEREAARRMRSLIEASPLPIVSLLPDGSVSGWNPAAERVFGWTAAELLGRPLPIVPPELQHEFRSFLTETMAGRGFHGRTARRRTREGQDLSVTISTAPVRDSDGAITGAVVIYEDITDRLRIERMNQQFQERLLEAQKLESVGVLAGGIAHDFNNLLTMVLGNTHLARAELPADSPAREALLQVEHATQRAAELTAQMLAYAGKGRFVVGPVDVSQLVRASERFLEAALPPGARLQLDVPPGLPPIEGDPTQLRQVLLILVANAGESLESGRGTVSVRTGTCELGRAYLLATTLPQSLREGRYVYLEVTDTGGGIPPEVQARMFDPFFSTKFSGRGLGLAAALGITRRHHGSIRVDTRPGEGTTMRVLLPLSPRALAAPGETAAPPPEAADVAVLIVDDEEDVLRLMRTFLERGGFTVHTAASGEEALARFRTGPEAFAAVILDLTMPGMGGDEALAEIRRIDALVPVILTSGYSEEEVARRCAGLSFTAFLPKPYLPAELIEEVRRAATVRHPRPDGSPVPGSR